MPETSTKSTPQELIQKAEALNTTIYNKLNTDFGNARTKLDDVLQIGGLQEAIKTTVRDARDSLTTATGTISEVQTQNLNFLNSFSNFATQNYINQSLTGFYAQNQSENVNTISKAGQQEAHDKLRMTEINDYYIKKNQVINKMIRNILIIFAIILIIIILTKKEIIPTNVGYFIGSSIIIITILYVIYNIFDINSRDKLNFDEYQIPFNYKDKIKDSCGNLVDISTILKNELMPGIKSLEGGLGCIGESCCAPGTIYDTTYGQCIDKCIKPSTYQQTTDIATGAIVGECVEPPP